MSKVILAIDTDNFGIAKELTRAAFDKPIMIKMGLQLFVAHGQDFSYWMKCLTPIPELFLDLKFNDIPDTVERAILACQRYRPKMLTIHLSQAETIRRAVKVGRQINCDVVGVTILTSMVDEDLGSIGYLDSVKEYVTSLFCLGYENGIRTFVCSGKELTVLKSVIERLGWEVCRFVVPGVRSSGAIINPQDSQRRIMTPKEAVQLGADYIVVGRQVRDAVNPEKELTKILTELE